MTDYKRIKKLNLPLWAMNHEQRLIIQATGEPQRVELGGDETGGKTDATVLECIRVDTGEVGQLILSAVMLSSLLRSGAELTGRYFEFVTGPVAKGKRYRQVECYEIEQP